MIRINQLKTDIHNSEKLYRKRLTEMFSCDESAFRSIRVVRRSVDARKKPDISYIYTIDVEIDQEQKYFRKLSGNRKIKEQISLVEPTVYKVPAHGTKKLHNTPVIIGMGPAGLFCAYLLAKEGYKPILLERGKSVEERSKDVELFWESGKLNLTSNVQFGEGGAGTFSDGKLNTLVKDKDGRNLEVLKIFVQNGAKEDILYDAKPHIGTDVLKTVVKNIREEILRMGGQVRFESQVTDVILENDHIAGVVVNGKDTIECSNLVLAIGHSARDTFSMLLDKNIPMEAKSFAVGLRVEHPQAMINQSQYGVEEYEELGAAAYKIAAKTSVGRGVYSFCMCPGGYVVNASSEEGRLAVNGMSYSGRSGEHANSAIIVSVTPADYGCDGPLSGIEFQRRLEEKAYELGQGFIPVQRYGIFKECVEKNVTQDQLDPEEVAKACEEGFAPNCKGAYRFVDVTGILPAECNKAFVEGMEQFGRQIKGFNRADTLLLGVESRTSSPVRIHRDENLQSTIRGLYPCGEGAGYAGGITSAAMDGLRVAEQIISEYAAFSEK